MKKVLVIGVILLFIGVSVQPSMGTDVPEKIEVEPKDYLFQTIVDISNNPEVKELFEQVKDKGIVFISDYNFRNVYLKLLFRNPRLFCSLLFTKYIHSLNKKVLLVKSLNISTSICYSLLLTTTEWVFDRLAQSIYLIFHQMAG